MSAAPHGKARKLTPQQRVKHRHKNAGAQFSAMYGWQIMDYTDQYSPKLLGSSRVSEAAAWRNVARRGI